MPDNYALFATELGDMAISWNERGITRIQLPENDLDTTQKRLLELQPGAKSSKPPRWVRDVIKDIQSHLRGDSRDFSQIKLDLDEISLFFRRVYKCAQRIPPGETVTYGELAKKAGSPQAARAVGQALGRNPFVICVPCHRVVSAGGKPGGFSSPGGLVTKRKLLEIEGGSLPGVDGEWRQTLATAEKTLAKADPLLAHFIEQIGRCRMELQPINSPFESLLRAVVYQQLSTKAAKTILQRVKDLFSGTGFPSPNQVLDISVEKLRGAGLSQNKTLAVKDLAEQTIAGNIPSLQQMKAMTDEEIIAQLTAVRGIGRWTVEMLLIFGMGRLDVLPTTDYGIRKGFARVVNNAELPTPSEVASHGERWKPYRSIASWYLWRALELPE